MEPTFMKAQKILNLFRNAYSFITTTFFKNAVFITAHFSFITAYLYSDNSLFRHCHV